MHPRLATALDDRPYCLAESPCYDPRYGRLSWVDIPNGSLWTRTANGTTSRLDLGQPLGAAVPLARSDGFALAARDGLYLWEHNRITLARSLHDHYQPSWRSNDAKADPAGRLWFGAVVEDDSLPPAGNLYRYDGTEVDVAKANTLIANGMAWSPDLGRCYVCDSGRRAVFCHDYDVRDGALANGRTLFVAREGVPDGLCMDADGNLWVALYGAGRVELLDGRDGRRLTWVEVPASDVSSCCLGGRGLRTLFVTTADAGIFCCEVPTPGNVPNFARV